MDKKKDKLRNLLHLYLFILILTLILVFPAHLLSQPYFMPFRFPHYLEKMQPFLGISWPLTFEIYHLVLLTIGAIGVINVLGLFFGNVKSIAKFSSLIGLFLFSLMVLFFFFIFIGVNAPTAVIYGLYSAVLLIVDLLTLKALIKKEKEASRA